MSRPLRTYTVQAPDGRTITLEGPDGAPQDEVIRRAQSMYQQQYGGGSTSVSKPKPKPAPGFGGSGTYTREMSPSQLQGEMDLQRLEGVGIDPSSPIIGTGKNIIGGIGELIKPLVEGGTGSPKAILEFGKNVGSAGLGLLKAPFDWAEGMISGVQGDEEGFQRANRGMGTALSATVPAARAVSKIPGAISNSRNLSLGRTSLDDLGGIRPPIKPTIVEVGVAPKLTGTELLQYHPSVQLLAEGLGGKSNLLKMNRLQQAFNEALPDLKAAQSSTIRTAIDSPEKLRLVADIARNRVWNDSIAPAIVGEVELTPIGEGMLRSIPDSIRIQRPKQYLALVKDINSRFINKRATAQQVHGFAKEARAAIRSALAKNDFDMAAALETPSGKMAAAYNDTLRDVLWKHVETQTGRDIRPQLQRYGALSDIEQSALKSTVPPTFIERLFGSYVPPTQSGLKGRIGASVFGHWIDDYSKVRRAFDQYQLEPQKVTQPFNARYTPPSRQLGTGMPPPEPMRPEMSMGEPIIQVESAPSVTRANSLPLPMNESRLNYGAGYNQPAYENFQYTGEVPPTPPLRQPSGPGVLKSSSVFPKSPKSGDRFRYNNETYIYTRNGWVPYVKPKTSTPKRSLPPLDEP